MSMPYRDRAGGHGEARVLNAALGRFAERGYHGSSIRDIAGDAGLSVPGLYHHYRAKQDILLDLMENVLSELLVRTRAAIDLVPPGDASARFDALVGALLVFHIECRAEAFVASTELRSLEPANLRRVVTLRDEQQAMLEEAIVAGCEHGVFATSRPHDAARAVAVLCVGVASWYRPGGGDPPAAVVDRQLALCRALVQAGG